VQRGFVVAVLLLAATAAVAGAIAALRGDQPPYQPAPPAGQTNMRTGWPAAPKQEGSG
jgi:hypothetical protein